MIQAGVVYSQDNIVVREAFLEDAHDMAPRMRKEDAHEIYASHRHTPLDALLLSVRESTISFTVEIDEKPEAMFGVTSGCLSSGEGIVWLLSSDKLFEQHGIRFLRNSRKFIDIMLECRPYLYNYVHNDNRKSIQWLLRMGAEMEQPGPYGISGELFRYFYFKR